MVIALATKPGINGANTLSIPKDWDATWFRKFIANSLKGADVRNAVGSGGIVVSGSIASPYATIGFGAPVTLPGQVTITAPTSGIPALIIHTNPASGEGVRVLGTSSGVGNIAYISFFESNGTVRTGYVGDGGSGDSNIYLVSDSGSVAIQDVNTGGALKLYQAGSFVGTLTGMTTTVTGSVRYVIEGNTCTLYANFTGTSNTTGMTLTGLPANVQAAITQTPVCLVVDNGNAVVGAAVVTGGSGTITFARVVLATGTASGSGFTASGTKGLSNLTLTYSLST